MTHTFSIMLPILLVASVLPAGAATLLVEAETFRDPGGWVLDQQFMDQMGSPFLLAHGLGLPVADASTTVMVPAAGRYRVFARTRDWVASWTAPGAPGRFQVLVNGKPLETTFGTEGAAWHWQPGGTVVLPGGEVRLELHDLTGFEGRCDAILLTDDPGFTPPDGGPALAAFRREALGLSERPEDAGRYDLVVVGGGFAGTCAAISAATLGLDVALVQDRPVLGGNASAEVRVGPQGDTGFAPYPHIGDVVRELDLAAGPPSGVGAAKDKARYDIVAAEKRIHLFLDYRVNGVEAANGALTAVVAQDIVSAKRIRIAGRWFADCTGDGCVGFLAGADYEISRDDHMGPTNLWGVGDTGKPASFPSCPWALDLKEKPFPGRAQGSAQWAKPGLGSLGGWFWESGFSWDPFADAEQIRDWNLRAMYGAWDALKNVDRLYPNHAIRWAAFIAGKRESRRLLGDVVLTEKDLTSGRAFPDGCVPSTWGIDVHVPHPQYRAGFEGKEFIAYSKQGTYPRPYWVPYRCLYSRSISNLFMAGRDISVTHDALGAVRVMRTCGMMGEVVGMAASLCKAHETTPRGVYAEHLDELKKLMERGLGRPAAVAARARGARLEPVPPEWGRNLALAAKVSVSGSDAPATNPPGRVNDGKVNLEDLRGRWLSERQVPNWVELAWEQPVSLGAARIVSGWYHGQGLTDSVIEDFVIEYDDGTGWRPIPETRTKGNTAADWRKSFAPVTARRLRLNVVRTPGDLSRIYEWEVYPEAKP